MRRQTLHVGFAGILSVALMGFLAPFALAAGKDVAGLRFVSDERRAGGASLLSRDGEAGTVSARINATHLMRGAAYTYWWVIFNRPENCSPPGCGDDDIFNPDGSFNLAQIEAAHIVALGGNGEIANNGGRATFTGTLFENSAAGHFVLIGPGGLFDFGFDWLLEDAMTAEIHIVLRNHGPARSGADLASQLTTFDGNCIGIDPEGTFECSDEQFATHK